VVKKTDISQVPRNDIDAARAYYREHKPLDPEEVEMLLMLQDKPTTLLAVMKRERWQAKPGHA
jgi:Ser/Thr protein kinase RdoA (MazF antagonist)